MNTKKQILSIVVISVFVGWFFNFTFGKLLTAKISTLPILNRWKILSPDAPIVINNREIVHISEGADILQAADSIKLKTALLVEISPEGLNVVSGVLNLTSDGSFVVPKEGFLEKPIDRFYVLLNDGRYSKILQRVYDPATNMVFFKTDLESVPVASFGNSVELGGGEKIFFTINSSQDYINRIFVTYITKTEKDFIGKIFMSDFSGQEFLVSDENSFKKGAVAVNSKGEVVGMWDGNKIVSASALKEAVALYFKDKNRIARPSYGFLYQIIGKNEAILTSKQEGLLVKEVHNASSSHKAGLLVGDVIFAINGKRLSGFSPTNEVLSKFLPGDKAVFSVTRKNLKIDLNILITELN